MLLQVQLRRKLQDHEDLEGKKKVTLGKAPVSTQRHLGLLVGRTMKLS